MPPALEYLPLLRRRATLLLAAAEYTHYEIELLLGSAEPAVPAAVQPVQPVQPVPVPVPVPAPAVQPAKTKRNQAPPPPPETPSQCRSRRAIIRDLFVAGVKRAEIARRVGCSPQLVTYHVRGGCSGKDSLIPHFPKILTDREKK